MYIFSRDERKSGANLRLRGFDFAFASLIHEPKESLREIFQRLYAALNDGGVIRFSLKYADVYEEFTKEDEFGIRTYYLYTKQDVEDIVAGFTILKNDLHEVRGQTWLEAMVQKRAAA